MRPVFVNLTNVVKFVKKVIYTGPYYYFND
jgi:hypothetical protein